MKKNKNNWTDGKFIKKLEQRFLEEVEKAYEVADGKLYVAIDGAELSYNEDYCASIDLKVRFGREQTDYPFQKELNIVLTDGNLDFLAGQFAYATFCYDMYGVDGK